MERPPRPHVVGIDSEQVIIQAMPDDIDTESRIVREAQRMLEESGESAFRVAELARRCDVAISLLYHYFRDRDGLLAAAR